MLYSWFGPFCSHKWLLTAVVSQVDTKVTVTHTDTDKCLLSSERIVQFAMATEIGRITLFPRLFFRYYFFALVFIFAIITEIILFYYFNFFHQQFGSSSFVGWHTLGTF